MSNSRLLCEFEELSVCLDKEDDEEDRSMYQAYLSPDCNNVQLKKG